jgi:pimeloyl-ACP methyl ester carboxylesterase
VPVPPRLQAHVVNVYYLHGFASGATSTKARWLADKLAPFGIELRCPDFNLPDFSTLTVTRMIADVQRWMAADGDGPVALFGSSLGALVAYHTAVANPRVNRLILLAPALDIAPSLRRGLGGTKVEHWHRDGSLEIFHYGYNEARRVNYTLFEDCERYDPFTTPLAIPIMIVQGSRDESVDPTMVERFAATRPNVELHMVDDDHQLIASLPFIWDASRRFLGL